MACTARGGIAIDRVEPASGPNTKDTAVQIAGSGFLPFESNVDEGTTTIGTISVSIGGVAIPDALWLGENMIAATVPAGMDVGPHDVTVTFDDQTATLPLGYTVTTLGSFGPPVMVSISQAGTNEDDVTLTGDMLEIFFESNRVPMFEGDVYTATRAKITDDWGPPARIDVLSTMFSESSMEISTDGLTMYFSSTRTGTLGGQDIWVSTRPDRSSPWIAPMHVLELSSQQGDYNAQPWSATVLYLGSDRPPTLGGSSDVYRATRATANDPWDAPARVPGHDTPIYEGEAFCDSARSIWYTGPGGDDLFRSDPAPDGTYMAPIRIDEIASPADENDAWLSPDLTTIYFTSNRNGTLDVFMATRQ